MKKQWGILLALMLCAASAVGQDSTEKTLYVGLEGAYFTPSGGSSAPGFRATSRSRAVSARRLLLGYQFDQNFGLELAYFATGDYLQSATNGVASYDARLSAHGEDLAAVYRFTESLPGLFVKAGVSQSKLDTAVVSRARFRSGFSTSTSSGLGYLAGFGYGIKLSKSIEARLGYSFYTSVGGQSNIKLHMLSAGVGYGF